MNYEPFYNLCQSLPDNERQWVDVFYNRAVEVFGEEDPNFQRKDNICKLFYGGGKGLSKAQYYRKRNLVRKFYEWLYEQNLVTQETLRYVNSLEMSDVVSEDELIHYYFKSLDAALDFVKLVGVRNGCGDKDDLLSIKTVVILSWYMVDIDQIVEIQKKDLDRENKTVLIHNGKETHIIQLTTEYFETLRRFSELDLHKGFPSCNEQMYLQSPYLMRSSKQQQVSPNNIHCAIRKFNTVAEDYGKRLSPAALKKNGIFYKVFENECEGKTVAVLIKELINCDRQFAFGYKEFYERWKKLFMESGDES